jgi:hypothetical protein
MSTVRQVDFQTDTQTRGGALPTHENDVLTEAAIFTEVTPYQPLNEQSHVLFSKGFGLCTRKLFTLTGL